MAPRARRRKVLLVSISAALAMTGAAYLKARRRRNLYELVGELAGVVAQRGVPLSLPGASSCPRCPVVHHALSAQVRWRTTVGVRIPHSGE